MSRDKIEKDEQLKKSMADKEAMLDEIRKTQQRARDSVWNMKQDKRDEAKSKASQEVLKNAKTLNDWCAEVLKKSAAGYENFASVMNSMTPGVIMIADMVFAANPIGTVLGKLFLPIVDRIEYHMLSPLFDAAGNKINSIVGNIPEGTVPGLQYFVDLNPNGTLAVHSLGGNLRRTDGKPITPEQEEFFEAGVAAWIKTTNNNKYQLSKRADGAYDVTEGATGNKLKREDFLQLRDDPVYGMNAFMNTRFDLVFEALDEKPEAPTPGGMGGP